MNIPKIENFTILMQDTGVQFMTYLCSLDLDIEQWLEICTPVFECQTNHMIYSPIEKW